MGGECGAYGGEEMFMQSFVIDLMERGYLEDLSIDGRIMLR